jgi:hypothetical protein
MGPVMMPERRRLLDRLIREIHRGEVQAIDQIARMERLLGDVAPAHALRAVAEHAQTLRERFENIIRGYDLQTGRASIGTTLASLRGLVTDRVIEPERAYRTCLLDLRHGLDVVKLAREVARSEELFGVIRWCDDYLRARRTLVARVEAQLAWFVEDARMDRIASIPQVVEDELRGTPIALCEGRHEAQDEADPEHRLGVHPSRTT